jgi:hypothetical protein
MGGDFLTSSFETSHELEVGVATSLTKLTEVEGVLTAELPL